jgi:hypothetical protein
MKKVISISEIAAPIRVEDDACEVWASADADYDEAKSRLEVKLESFLRRSSDNEHLSASWLPGKETVSERVDFEEGSPAAKEIFRKLGEAGTPGGPTKGLCSRHCFDCMIPALNLAQRFPRGV